MYVRASREGPAVEFLAFRGRGDGILSKSTLELRATGLFEEEGPALPFVVGVVGARMLARFCECTGPEPKSLMSMSMPNICAYELTVKLHVHFTILVVLNLFILVVILDDGRLLPLSLGFWR